MKKEVILCAAVCFFMFTSQALSRPMPAPTYKEGVKQSARIVVGSYFGREKKLFEKIDYFHGPVAEDICPLIA